PSAIYGSRLDAGGVPLDPLGVRLADAPSGRGPDAVIWNGEAFVIVADQALIFVSPDMTITDVKGLGLGGKFSFAAATSGSDPRLLFVDTVFPRDVSTESGSQIIVDRRGSVLSTGVVWTNSADKFSGRPIAVGANDSRFLVLREVRNVAGDRTVFAADQIDRDGNVLASTDAALPAEIGSKAGNAVVTA